MARIAGIRELDHGLATGPAMSRLTEKQRKFVLAMAADPTGTARDWALAAGYSDIANGAKVSGHRLHRGKLSRNAAYDLEVAIAEVARALLFRDAPMLAVTGLMAIARNKRHPKQLRALETLANRVGLHELSEHRVRVEHSEESAQAKAERIRMVAGLLGVDVTQLLGANVKDVSRETKAEPKLIEGKVETDGDAGTDGTAD